MQTVIVVTIFLVGGLSFYFVRTNQLNAQASADVVPIAAGAGDSTQAATAYPLGDMTQFITICDDTLSLLKAGKQAEATTRITDLETAWDQAQAVLKRRDATEWHAVDDKIDVVLRELRSTTPDLSSEEAALTALLTEMGA